MSHSPNSMPRSRSIQGKAFSWPMARMTSSHGMITVSTTVDCARRLVPLEDVELHPDERAVLDDEALGRVVHDDLDALFLGVLELPRRGLEVLARSPRHDLDVGAAEAPRRAAAVHGGVADADDQDPLADRLDVTEGHRLEPVDADEDAGRSSWRPGMSSSLPRGAPMPTKTESKPSPSSARRLVTGVL